MLLPARYRIFLEKFIQIFKGFSASKSKQDYTAYSQSPAYSSFQFLASRFKLFSMIHSNVTAQYTSDLYLSIVSSTIFIILIPHDRGNTVVKVVCYKSEGRWFDSTFALFGSVKCGGRECMRVVRV